MFTLTYNGVSTLVWDQEDLEISMEMMSMEEVTKENVRRIWTIRQAN